MIFWATIFSAMAAYGWSLKSRIFSVVFFFLAAVMVIAEAIEHRVNDDAHTPLTQNSDDEGKSQ